MTNRDALDRARPTPKELLRAQVVADVSSGEAEQLAASARELLAPQLASAQPWSATVETSTREVAFGGEGERELTSTPFEYRFSARAQLGEFEIVGTELRIGLTRLGELSSILVSEVEVHELGAAKIVRAPTQALEELEATIRAMEPELAELEFDVLRLGYALAEGEQSGEVEPSLLVGYVGTIVGPEGETSVSRRVPLRLSLVDQASSPESLAAVDASPDPGDQRAER